MVYFTSDLHLGHSNIISLCNRPFVNIEEMDKVLIENWNRKVKKNDTVYVMGDIVWDKKKVAYYMEQLTGRKILVIGNHDSHWAKKVADWTDCLHFPGKYRIFFSAGNACFPLQQCDSGYIPAGRLEQRAANTCHPTTASCWR